MCNHVRPVPKKLRQPSPQRIPDYYTKYTHAYSVPVIGGCTDMTQHKALCVAIEIVFVSLLLLLYTEHVWQLLTYWLYHYYFVLILNNK